MSAAGLQAFSIAPRVTTASVGVSPVVRSPVVGGTLAPISLPSRVVAPTPAPAQSSTATPAVQAPAQASTSSPAPATNDAGAIARILPSSPLSQPGTINEPAPVNSGTTTPANGTAGGTASLASILGQGYFEDPEAAGSDSGIGSSDTSLPPASTADVDALAPSSSSTSSSSSVIVIIVAIVAIAIGGFYWWSHRKKGPPA